MPLGCLLQMPHPGGICRAAPQPASSSQWKGPEVKDGKHGQLEHNHKRPCGLLLGFSVVETAAGNGCIDNLISVKSGRVRAIKTGVHSDPVM